MAREASVERNTKETEIKLKLTLDGTGYSDIETGVGFFNHMLDGFTRHGLFDLCVRVHGDLEVDDHHTIEDTGIVLGTAIKEAIGDKKGIRRYGSCILPMDEVLVLCAIDLSGRPYFSWDAEFTSEKIGDMSTEMVKRVFLCYFLFLWHEPAYQSTYRWQQPSCCRSNVQKLCQSIGSGCFL